MAFSDPRLNSKLRKEAYHWNKVIKEINQAIETRKKANRPVNGASLPTSKQGKTLEALPEVYWSDTN